MVKASKARCSCVSHKCHLGSSGYTEVPRSTRQKHRDDDLHHALQRLSLNNTQHRAMPEPENVVGNTTVSASSVEDDETRTTVVQLKSTLEEFQLRMQSFNILAESLEEFPSSTCRQDCTEFVDMQDHISWTASAISNMKAMSIESGSSLDQQRNMLVHILQNKLKVIQHWEISRHDELQSVQRGDRQKVDCNRTAIKYENEKNFEHGLSSFHPLILLAMLLAVVLSVINGLPDRASNFLLQMLSDLLKLAFDTCNGDREFAAERSSILRHLPKDIRTVRSRFDLAREIRVFAACPNCSALFKSEFDSTNDVNVFSTIRCDRKKLGGSECGTTLLKWQVRGKQIVRAPIRPYGYFSLHDFVGELLARPGIEDLLERQSPSVQPDYLADIFDGQVIRDFQGPDGDFCFRTNGHFRTNGESDLYLAWAIFVDWFNPYHNKVAGKSVSVGVISLVCLNLPLEVRNEVQNVYVAGIIPGPQEPHLEQVNNFLAPLIDDFLQSWNGGIHYSKTHKFPKGRTVISVLIPLIADLPASRKVSGTVGHSATCFCPLCLRKNTEINDFSVSFSKRGRKEHMRLAEEWRNAPTTGKRESLAKDYGVRWSVLFDLPYWEPHFIVVDTMHNFFLGLVKNHFEKVIGIEYMTSKTKSQLMEKIKNQQVYGLSAKSIRKIMGILKDPQGPLLSKLRRCTNNELRSFHVCHRIPLPGQADTLTKESLVLSLMCCDLVSQGPAVGSNGSESQGLYTVEQSALPFFSLNDVSGMYMATHSSSRTGSRRSKAGLSPNKPKTIGAREIFAIQDAMRSTSRPSWQKGPAKLFGTSQQGKLKADQWRTLLEFDLPVTLVELWVDTDDADLDDKTRSRRLALVDVTMELAIALLWATSRRTSSKNAATYIHHIQRYLQGLQKLSPRPKLVANHHAALHVGEQLLFFGPVQGWWAYPFEQLIGVLQNASTNYRIGEMELTMLKSYHATAHLQRLVHVDHPNIKVNHLSKVGKYFPVHTFGSYGSNISESLFSSASGNDGEKEVIEHLDEDIYDTFCSFSQDFGERPTRQVLVHKAYILDGFKFTSLEYERDSIIFFDNGTCYLPGIIRKIFSRANGQVLFAVHPYVKLDRSISDPFARWPEFRAGLWSQRIDDQVQVINPKDAHVCHAACRPWKNQDVYVFRPLDRVGKPFAYIALALKSV